MMIAPTPVNGISYKLSCPHKCINTFMPGDDSQRFRFFPRYNRSAKYWVGFGVCPILDQVHYMTEAWSNL